MPSDEQVKNLKEQITWVRAAIDDLLGEAIRDLSGYDRVYCPLCKRGSSSPVSEGLRLPRRPAASSPGGRKQQ